MNDLSSLAIVSIYFGPPVYLLFALWRFRNSEVIYSNTPIIGFWIAFSLIIVVFSSLLNDPLVLVVSGGFFWPLLDIIKHKKRQVWQALLPLVSISLLVPMMGNGGMHEYPWWFFIPQGFLTPIIYWFWPRGSKNTNPVIERLFFALLLSPAITVLIIFIIPLFFQGSNIYGMNDFLYDFDLWINMMIIALPFTIIYGIPVSLFLRSKNQDDYLHYGIAGFVPSVIWVAYLINTNDIELLSIDSLLRLFFGILCAVLFRYFRGGVITEFCKADHKL